MSKRWVVRLTCLTWTGACGLASPPHGRSVDDEEVAKRLDVGYQLHRHLVVQAGRHEFGAPRGELLLGAGAHYELPSGLGILIELEDYQLGRAIGLGASWRF